MNGLILQRIGTAELRMEVARIIGDFLKAVIHLIIQRKFVIGKAFRSDSRSLSERHLPEAVHTVSRIHAHRKRIHGSVIGIVTVCEEVAERHFHGGNPAVVPVHTKNNESAGNDCRVGKPDMLNTAGAFDVGENDFRMRQYPQIGIHFPAFAEITRCAGCRTVFRRCTGAFFSAVIFGTDGTGYSSRKICK